MGLGVASLGVAYVGLIAATYKQQEAFMLLEGRLKNVYGSGAIAANMFKELTSLADKNGLSIDGTAESFLRLARNNEAIGLTRKQMIDLTDSVQMLGRVSGASQGEVSGGLMQFSQALAAGRLNGDELRSIMENLPALTKSIADGLGVSVGQLRAMGAEGQLTSEKITGALLGQLPKIREEFDNLPQTSEQAFQRVGNAWDSLIAHIGDRLNASGIVTVTANALAMAVKGADSVIRPETPEEAYKRITSLTDEQKYSQLSWWEKAKAASAYSGDGTSIPAGPTTDKLQQELLAAEAKMNVERYASMIADAKQEKDVQRAPFVRGTGLLKDGDDFNNKISSLQANLKTYQEARDALAKSPKLFEPEELARLKEFDRMIAVTNQQLQNSLMPLEKYAQATDRMAANRARYGAGGAASIGQEAQGLVDASLAQQHPISYGDAEAEVIRKRTVDLQGQTQAMDLQITSQENLKAAIGGGTAAQIDAEVANKALTLQMQLFGMTLDDKASKALDEYKVKLRELLQIQNDTTDAQKLYNTQLQLGIEAQITAAIKAGKTAGEVAALRQSLTVSDDFSQSMAGTAADTKLANGGRIPEQYQGYFNQASSATGIPVALLAALAQQESGFNPDAISSGNARGIMQILPSTAAKPGMGVTPLPADKLADPQSNIMFGAQYLAGLAQKNGLSVSNPADLRKLLRLYGGADAGGDAAYDTHVLNRLPIGAQASAASADLNAEKQAQTFEQKIAALEKEAANLREQAKAPTMTEEVRVKREQQIKQAGESGTTPTEVKELEAAMRSKLAAEDEAKIKERLRTVTQETEQMKKQAELAKLPPRERAIEQAVLDEINRELAQNIVMTEEQIDAYRKSIEKQKAYHFDAAAEIRGVWESAANSIGGALESAVKQAMENGKIDAKGILKGLVSDITMSLMHAMITKPLVDSLTGMFGAQGLVTGPQGASMYFAAGGVIDKPTALYGGPHMLAIGGEAGPEAVLPLKRGPDGKLGVGGGNGGGGTHIVVNDMRTAPGSEPVEAQESSGPDGSRMISIIVRDEVRKQIRNGDMDKEMRSSYGVSRQITRR